MAKAGLFSRIFKPRKLKETQLIDFMSLAGVLKYMTGANREMDESARAESSELAYNAYRTNPMGYNFVNVMTNFLFGPGVQISHSDETTNDLLREFIRKVKFGRRLIEWANGYRIDGVRYVVGYANTLTGEIKLREFDPVTVKNVVTAPDDYEDITGLYREYTERTWSDDGRSYRDEQKQELVRQDERTGYTVRHFFVWKRPTVGGETRGWSFLTPVFHYLVQYREFLKARLTLQKVLSMFAWKWILKGLKGNVTDKQADAARFQAALSSTIATGSQLVTAPGGDLDSGFDIEPITAGVTAGASNAQSDARALALQVAVGTSSPEGVATGDWSNANYSSLSLSIQTFIKNIQAEQAIWGAEGFIGELLEWVLSIWRDARLISEEAAGEPANISWPIIIPYDLNQLANILKYMRDDKQITKRTAAGLTPFDVDFDSEKEELEAEAEEAAKRAEAYGLQPQVPGQVLGQQPPQPPFNKAAPNEQEDDDAKAAA